MTEDEFNGYLQGGELYWSDPLDGGGEGEIQGEEEEEKMEEGSATRFEYRMDEILEGYDSETNFLGGPGHGGYLS